jgi:hypothetical protein
LDTSIVASSAFELRIAEHFPPRAAPQLIGRLPRLPVGRFLERRRHLRRRRGRGERPVEQADAIMAASRTAASIADCRADCRFTRLAMIADCRLRGATSPIGIRH